jgi:trimeric autotransporter adhesin
MRLGSPSYISSTYVAGIYGVNVSGVAVQINSNGQLGAMASSRRYKEQILDMGDSSSQLMRLRPVSFLYRPEYSDSPRKLQYGLIAEEVAEVYPELVEYGKDGLPYTVRYQALIPMLLNEAQKLYRRAEAQAAVITMQDQRIEQLELRLSRLEAAIGTQVRTAEDKSLDVLDHRASQ